MTSWPGHQSLLQLVLLKKIIYPFKNCAINSSALIICWCEIVFHPFSIHLCLPRLRVLFPLQSHQKNWFRRPDELKTALILFWGKLTNKSSACVLLTVTIDNSTTPFEAQHQFKTRPHNATGGGGGNIDEEASRLAEPSEDRSDDTRFKMGEFFCLLFLSRILFLLLQTV